MAAESIDLLFSHRCGGQTNRKKSKKATKNEDKAQKSSKMWERERENTTLGIHSGKDDRCARNIYFSSSLGARKNRCVRDNIHYK